MRRSRGFSLIELMIVVAIVGVLSSVAVASYQDYLRSTRMAKVSAHYQVATSFVRTFFSSAHARVAHGLDPSPPVPDTAEGWVALLDRESAPAPGGGPAFVPGSGDAVTGAIGITVTGTWADRDSEVTVTRPAYDALASDSMVLQALASY